MGLIISDKKQIDNYFASEALSQSKLKLLLKGPRLFKNVEDKKELYYEEKGHFIIGSVVDTILTGESKQFDEEYYVSKIQKKPGEALLSIVNEVFDLVEDFYKSESMSIETPTDYSFASFILDNGNKLEDFSEYVLVAMNNQEYCMKMQEETRLKRVYEATEYFQDLIGAYGKQILSREEKDLCDSIINSLKTNERTKFFFDRDSLTSLGDSIINSLKTNERTKFFFDRDSLTSLGVDTYYQLPIYFKTLKGNIDCKALLDIVIVFKKNGNIIKIEPFDLKTMQGYTIDFLGSLKSYRYDIQAVWYTSALYKYFNVDPKIVSNFSFVVESKSCIGSPLIYTLEEDILKIGLEGTSDIYVQNILIKKGIKGVQQLLEDYSWYEENGWEEEKVVKEKEGRLELSWDGIVE